MDTAGSGNVNENIRNDRKSRSRTRSRSRDPHSKHGRDDKYKERDVITGTNLLKNGYL